MRKGGRGRERREKTENVRMINGFWLTFTILHNNLFHPLGTFPSSIYSAVPLIVSQTFTALSLLVNAGSVSSSIGFAPPFVFSSSFACL
jgi:hypothetical protein